LEHGFLLKKRTSARRISPFTFTVRVIAAGLRVLVLCLRETGCAQTAIAFEDLPARAANRLRPDSGKLIVAVRLMERPAGYPEPAQPVKALEKLAFARQAANDKMRMR
jgi:hypothetical protein